MKSILVIFCLFLFVSSNAQIKSGELTYSLKRKEILSKKESDTRYNNLKEKIFEITTKLEFHLQFNDSISRFSLKQDLSIDIEDYLTKMAVLSTRGNNIFSYNRSSKILLEKTDFGGEIFIIKSKIGNLKWELHKEQKKIGDFLCYKATAKLTTEKHSGETIDRHYVVWYCPKIPFSYGPFNKVGLPGLVLEFSDNSKIFTMKSIKLSSEHLKINSLEKGRVVTKKEFDNITKQSFENKN